MWKQLLTLLLLLATTFTFAQKKEKVKGSRVLTKVSTPVAAFERLFLTQAFEVHLVQADSLRVEITTEYNLHNYIKI